MESIRSGERIKEQGKKISESSKRKGSKSPFRGLGLLLLLSCSLFSVTVKAQTWDELFNQKKTQIRYLGEQLIALKMYAGYLKKGYEIVGQGVNTVKNLKSGEFNMHQTFISSLKVVNPAIRNSSKVAEIIALQLSLNKSFSNIKGIGYLSASHQQYISLVKDEIQDECRKDLEELLIVITSGKAEMKDDERMKRLDKVYSSMLDKSEFTQSFCNEVSLLISQKKYEQESINLIQKFYEKD